ncbi:MAG: phosphopyruvate hydratase [Candidatus Moranbacteria bacterium]|nr:phosphopyruvate hydratase [Candidatus Moranbacteria bacterium]
MKIKKIESYEILDSRGNPTLKTKVTTSNGVVAKAAVPSGASTGTHEALELRDNDSNRYNGKGVLKAVKNVNETIAPALQKEDVNEQKKLDQRMLELDGSDNKKNLGANAILSVSLAVARAAALEKKVPLWRHLNEISNLNKEPKLPTPTCNVINGGAHADWVLDFQEYMLVPNGFETFREKIRAVSETYHVLKKKLKTAGHIVSVGDEGGFAPKLVSNEEALKYLVKAIEEAGYLPGSQISLAMDTASSEFFNREIQKYELKVDNESLKSQELVDLFKQLSKKYPIILIEDGMAEDDLQGWKRLNRELGGEISIMGDDFTVTDKARLKKAVQEDALNSILIKVNQIGTLSETFETIELAYENNCKVSVSHRSGETCDDFIADLAFAVASDWIKSGSLARSERVGKYNRLIEIEREII